MEFTFVPADYTVECSDEMPMDDAVASDNCGEVTIEVSSETTAGDAAATTPSFARSLQPTMLNSASATQTITSRTPPLLSSPSSLPTTAVGVPTRCQWTTLWRLTTAVRSPSRCQAKPLQAMPPATTPLFARSLQPTMLETALGFADHHRSGHHSAGFTFVPADYTVECSDEMRNGRRHGVDNWWVTIEVSSETTASDAAGNYTIVRTFTATDDAGNSARPPRPSRPGHHRSEFTFVPADYTVECSDEMPMDDATASDNCGGHHRGVQRDDGWQRRRQLRDRSHVHRNRRCWQQRFGLQTITVEDTTAPEFTFVPADYTVECSDEMPMDDATASTTAVR